MSSKIFYFSGTGNSLQIAQDISKGIGGTELISINNETKTELLVDDVVGIVFPIYCWCMPLVVEKFARQLKVSDATYVFAVCNYGGTPLGAMGQIKDILSKNGVRLNSDFAIKMPGNYIVMYGANSDVSQNKRFEKEKAEVERISEIIKARKDIPFSKGKYSLNNSIANIMHKALIKIHPLDENFNVNQTCTSCGLCVKKCPVNNIKIVDGKPTWQHNCERCMACIQYCPAKAINYGKSTTNRKRYVNPNVK